MEFTDHLYSVINANKMGSEAENENIFRLFIEHAYSHTKLISPFYNRYSCSTSLDVMKKCYSEKGLLRSSHRATTTTLSTTTSSFPPTQITFLSFMPYCMRPCIVLNFVLWVRKGESYKKVIS